MSNLRSSKSQKLTGVITAPGDKSISHRSLILTSMAIGTSSISGILEGDDVIATANAMRSFGVQIEQKNGKYLVNGVGIGGLHEPSNIVDMGNSGTAVRLLMGLVSTYNFNTIFTGDKSLCNRPMKRVITPLEKIGAKFTCSTGERLPLTVHGTCTPVPTEYKLPVASAQVKSAILLSALNTLGITTVIEPVETRDHTEIMLKSLGANIKIEKKNNCNYIKIQGHPELNPIDINIPGDPSSAAFIAVAALITPNSDVTINNICLNPHRTGLYTTLQEMGADITFLNERTEAGEKIADIQVRSSKLKGITVPASRAPSMIDEYPILSIAASSAEGITIMEGLTELKVKESNRLQAIADGLLTNGVKFEMGEDSLTVYGSPVPGGGNVSTCHDHRIAMSFLILGMIADEPVTIDDDSMINTSFPGFVECVNGIGGKIAAI